MEVKAFASDLMSYCEKIISQTKDFLHFTKIKEIIILTKLNLKYYDNTRFRHRKQLHWFCSCR